MSTQSLLYMLNLLTIPLYLCNPVTFTGNSSITSTQTDPPTENQLQDADTVSTTRTVPGPWTVWTRISSAGTILVALLNNHWHQLDNWNATDTVICYCRIFDAYQKTKGWNRRQQFGCSRGKNLWAVESVKKSGDNAKIINVHVMSRCP